MKNYLIFAPTQYFLPQDLSGERDFSLWHILSLELVMCIQAKHALYGHIALNLGSLYLRRLTDWGRHVCWPLISRALHTGPAWNCFQEWLGLECWQEISIWAQPSVKLNYWQSETGIVRSRQNNLFEWKPQTCQSKVYLTCSFRVRAALSLLEHFQCLSLVGP